MWLQKKTKAIFRLHQKKKKCSKSQEVTVPLSSALFRFNFKYILNVSHPENNIFTIQNNWNGFTVGQRGQSGDWKLSLMRTNCRTCENLALPKDWNGWTITSPFKYLKRLSSFAEVQNFHSGMQEEQCFTLLKTYPNI